MIDPALTLFSTCKPFTGESARIQTNALRSWAHLHPAPRVVIFGAEPGVTESCRELGFAQVPEVDRSEYGTPRLDGLFDSAERVTDTQLLGYVNADIMLTSELCPAVEVTRRRFPRFLLIARRWNLDLAQRWDFAQPDWESRLAALARRAGALEPAYGGMDLFVYPRGLWERLPAFAMGRGRWDSALIFYARKRGVPVIDATEAITCVHQNHGYAYHPGDRSGLFKGPEAVTNTALLGGDEFIFTALNATHRLNRSGLRRQVTLYPPYLLRRLATAPALHPSLRPLVPVIRRLAPIWRRTMRAIERRA